jgi:hypothetical protein
MTSRRLGVMKNRGGADRCRVGGGELVAVADGNEEDGDLATKRSFHVRLMHAIEELIVAEGVEKWFADGEELKWGATSGTVSIDGEKLESSAFDGSPGRRCCQGGVWF